MQRLDDEYRQVFGPNIPNAVGATTASQVITPRRRSSCVPAGPVTVTRTDGSVVVQPAYTRLEVRKLVKERITISPGLRSRILRRDRGCCRYCGTSTGPFEIDHVIPVALGGITHIRNLVTACRGCNQTKGARIWTPRRL
jgi:hypothetical protein